MSDVIVSYKREDEARVATLVHALESVGLDVWWDREISGGERWRQRILSQLEAAKCVIVVWSEGSTGPDADFVIDEATRAQRKGRYLPVRIDDVELPLGFGERQALDLINWKGDEADLGFQDVIAAARALIEGQPIPAPRRRRRRKAIARAAVGFVVAAVGFIADLTVGPQVACRIPGVRTLCGGLGLGGVPSRVEETLWSNRPPGSCDGLRSYLSQFPEGAYAEQAQALLAAATSETKETWAQEERRLPLFVRIADHASPSEEAARADALARAGEEARRACAGFDQAEFRLRDARAVAVDWRCRQREPSSYACGFDGEAVCEVEVRRVDRIEQCL